MADKIVSLRMPKPLVEELKALADENHYLDLSEEIRSILRDKYLQYADPYSSELEQIRKNISNITVPEKIEALKKDLKAILEGLDGFR